MGRTDEPDYEALAGSNIRQPVLNVYFRSLKSLSDESEYKRECPACNVGFVAIRRNQDAPFFMRNNGWCLLCGQQFIYNDIEDNKYFFLE